MEFGGILEEKGGSDEGGVIRTSLQHSAERAFGPVHGESGEDYLGRLGALTCRVCPCWPSA